MFLLFVLVMDMEMNVFPLVGKYLLGIVPSLLEFKKILKEIEHVLISHI